MFTSDDQVDRLVMWGLALIVLLVVIHYGTRALQGMLYPQLWAAL